MTAILRYLFDKLFINDLQTFLRKTVDCGPSKIGPQTTVLWHSQRDGSPSNAIRYCGLNDQSVDIDLI